MLKATFYCDESGNTGKNWLDPDQPIFTDGGWLVPDKVTEDIVSGMNNIFSMYKGRELKSSKFFKMGKANEYFEKFYKFMLNGPHNNIITEEEHVPCFPIFIVADKSYIVAPKIVETFFDPAYNCSLNNGITYDIKLKKQLAEIIMRKRVVYSFSKLIYEGTISLPEMKKIQTELAEEFSMIPNVSKNITSISDDGLNEMIDEFNMPNTSRSLTVPILTHLMQVLQKFSATYNFETKILHDDIKGYDDWIDIIENTFLSKGENEVVKTEDFEFNSRLLNIQSLKLEDSKNNRIIQGADLLSGFISRNFIKISNGIALDEIEKEIMGSMFVLNGEFNSWDYVFPKQLIIKYLNSLDIQSSSEYKVDYKDLDTQFVKYLNNN